MYPQFPGAERCPPEIQMLITWCWADEPNDRPTARKVLKVLRSLASHKTKGGSEGNKKEKEKEYNVL